MSVGIAFGYKKDLPIKRKWAAACNIMPYFSGLAALS